MILKPLLSFIFGAVLLGFINDTSTQYIELLQERVATFPNEKVYIHQDKPVYVAGDDLWFKVYLVDARSHLQNTPSRLVYVDMIDQSDSIIATRAIKIDTSFSCGDITLPADLKTGSYTLRGYTNYMRNFDEAFFYSKRLKVIGTDDVKNISMSQEEEKGSISMDFFPEGGDLALGLKSKVAFKSIGEDGLGKKVEGKLVDDVGNQIAIVRSLHRGMGYFEMTPEAGRSYKAVIQNEGREFEFALPTIKEEAYVLQVNTSHKDYITLRVSHSDPSKLENTFVIGHIRGEPAMILQSLENGKLLRLPKSEVPEGVLHLTLFDNKSRPTAERLVYVDNEKSVLDVDAKLESSRLAPKSLAKVVLNIDGALIDTVGIANLSVSITDKSLLPTLSGSDIANYLLLDSELSGSVEDIQYYFVERTRKKRVLLDLVMMTNGWRRFNWKDIIDKKEPSLSFPPESGFEIKGTVTKKNKSDKPLSADLFLTVMTEQFQMHQLKTGANGRFAFSELEIDGTAPLVLQANESKTKKKSKKGKDDGPSGNRNVDIILDSIIYPANNLKPFQMIGFAERDPDYGDYKQVLDSKLELDKFLEGEMSVDLSEVTVKGKRITREQTYDRPGQLYKDPDNRIILEDIPGLVPTRTVYDIVRTRVPGVEIIGIPGIDAEFRIRGISSINLSSTAVVLVDGVQVSSSYVNTLVAEQIEYIDVLKGLSKTAIYGAAGANGVVAIYTKSVGSLRRPNRKSVNGVLNSSVNGYYQAREFYVPDYLASPNNQGVPDIRPTLYWNPNVTIDQSGEAILEFYTAQKQSTYRVDIQGLTKNGIPVIGGMEFEVQ